MRSSPAASPLEAELVYRVGSPERRFWKSCTLVVRRIQDVNCRHASQTPKALTNFSPAVGASDNPGDLGDRNVSTPKVLANAFSVRLCGDLDRRVAATPGLKLANAFGVQPVTVGCSNRVTVRRSNQPLESRRSPYGANRLACVVGQNDVGARAFDTG